MAQATVKLFASLSDFLPPGSRNNTIQHPIAESSTIGSTLAELHIPKERCHLVLLNGVFVSPSARANCAIKDGDTIAVWPPVAGG